MLQLIVSTGLSTKKNVAISSTKDFSGNNLWGTSTVPIGGTLPLRGPHGKSTPTPPPTYAHLASTVPRPLNLWGVKNVCLL